ncbi:MAG: serine/threonine protein kinase [Candidatus Berkiella sp.]
MPITLQQWQALSENDRNAFWLKCEQSDPIELSNIWKIEWQLAHDYFAQDEHKNQLKMNHKGQGASTRHSFIQIDGKVYMLARKDKLLGEGSFGKVKPTYFKDDEADVLNQNAEQCIVKVIKAQEAEDEAAVAREAYALEQLGELYAKGERDLPNGKKKFYLVAKRHEGKELYELLMQNKLNNAELLIIAYQCCELLEQAHQKGILHLDLKPENILVDIKNGVIQVKLIDWGLSVPIHDTQEQVEVDICGTPGYISPEILNATSKASVASDIFSLGAIFRSDFHFPLSECENMLHHDSNKRISLQKQKSKLLTALDNLLDDEKTPSVLEFIHEKSKVIQPVSEVIAVPELDKPFNWRLTVISTILNTLKEYRVNVILNADDRWQLDAQSLGHILKELEAIHTNIDLDDNEKLTEFDKVLKRIEHTYYGAIRVLFHEQCDNLAWERDYNTVFDVFDKMIASFNEDDNAFFQEHVQPAIDAFDDINSNYLLEADDKSIAFYKAMVDLLDSYLEKVVEEPRYLPVIRGLNEALEKLKVIEEPTLETDAESEVDELFASFGIQVEKNDEIDDAAIDKLMKEMEAESEPEPELDYSNAVSTQMDEFIEALIEYNQVHYSNQLSIIIENLQTKMQRIYYQRNPKQCIEAVIAENDVAMEDIDTAVFLLEQLEPWQVSATRLKEQTQEFIQGQELLEQLQLDEELKFLELKQNIFDYAIYLFRQKAHLQDDKSEFYTALIKYINNRKRIDSENESFLISLLGLQTRKADQQYYADIMGDIREIYQQLGAEYHIDLSQLADKLAGRKAFFKELAIEPPARRLPSSPIVEFDLKSLSKLLAVDEAFLNKHAVIRLILKGLQESLAIKRDSSASMLVLEMTKLIQKIESLPDDMPHRSKLAVIKSYLANKENELKAQRALDLLKQLDENVLKIFADITTNLQEHEWASAVSLTQQDFAVRALSPAETTNVELLQRAIDLLASKYSEIINDDSIKWDRKPTKDDLAAISSQIQHKLALYQEGLLKINPEHELRLILKNTSHNPRLTQLAQSVAEELDFEIDFSEAKVLERNPDELVELKVANARRAEEITRIKQSWTALAEKLCAKPNPDKNDYLVFSEQLFKETIDHLSKWYQDANAVQRKNLSAHVIPSLEQHFAAVKEKVVSHYITSQQQKILALKNEHADIADSEHEAQQCKKMICRKLELPESPVVRPNVQYQELKLVIKPSDIEEQIALLNPVTVQNRTIITQDANALEKAQQQKLLMNKSHSQSQLDKLLQKMKQIDLEYLKERKSLDDAYHLIIAYDPKAKRSITFYAQEVLKAKEDAIKSEQERLKNVEIIKDVSDQIKEAQLANIELEIDLENKLEQAKQAQLIEQTHFLEQMDIVISPLSLADSPIEPIRMEPLDVTVPALDATHYQQLPLTDSLLHIQEQVLFPQDENALLTREIYQAQRSLRHYHAESLVDQHRDSFEFSEQDKPVLQRIKEIAEKVKLLKQQTATRQGPSLPTLLKELNDLKSEHAALHNRFKRNMVEIEKSKKTERHLLNNVMNDKITQRNTTLSQFKEAAKALDAVLVDPVAEYHAKQRHHEHLFARKWFKSQAKSVGRRIYGKERSRSKQCKFIEDVFLGIQQDVKASDILSVKERAIIAYQCLAQVQREILDERNVFSSDLFKVCEKQMQKIEDVLRSLKAIEPPVVSKLNMSEEAFMKTVFYQRRNAADQELPLELRIINHCKKYNAIPQTNMHFGQGGTLTMLESNIQRELAQIQYFAEFGSHEVRVEALKLLAKLHQNEDMKQFEEKSAARISQMQPVEKKVSANVDLQKISNKDRKQLISEKVAYLKKEYLADFDNAGPRLN